MLEVDNNHPTFALVPQIQDITQGFLTAHGLHYFQYLRCYKNGKIALLSDTPQHFVRFCQQGFHIANPLDQEHTLQQNYSFLVEETYPADSLEFIIGACGLYSTLTSVHRNKDYYNLVSFAHPRPCGNTAAFYLSRMPAIENFTALFKQAAKPLIIEAETNPIILPPENADPHTEQLCIDLATQRYEVSGRYGPTYITGQELTCLRLHFMGKELQEISAIICVLPRTVESILKSICRRAGLSHRADFAKLLSCCP